MIVSCTLLVMSDQGIKPPVDPKAKDKQAQKKKVTVAVQNVACLPCIVTAACQQCCWYV